MTTILMMISIVGAIAIPMFIAVKKAFKDSDSFVGNILGFVVFFYGIYYLINLI